MGREERDDVVVFDSGILEDDLPVVGLIRATLFVSSSVADTDFVVTVSDAGAEKSMLVRYGAVRMRWRSGDQEAAPPMVPGEIYEVEVDLWHTAYIFPKGHKIRVSISSAAYPYYDANPNTGSFEVESISPSKFSPIAAKSTIHMGPKHPSRISLPVVKMEDIPQNPDFHASLNPWPVVPKQPVVIV